MPDFNFSYKDGGYSRRAKAALILNIVISCIFGLIVAASGHLIGGFGVAAFVFLVQYFKSDRWDRTFIINISFTKESTSIEFLDRETKINLSGPTKEFLFKKRIALNRTKTAYLAIYPNKELKIKQFEIGDWTENKMDEIITRFNNLNL